MKNDRPKCKVKGCNNLAIKNGKLKDGSIKYRSICEKHRRGSSLNASQRRRKKAIKEMDMNRCSMCNWNGPCDAHRLLMGCNGGKYVKGNVIIVCPNCHRLIHRGLIKIK